MVKIVIQRTKRSYDYKFSPEKKSDYGNNAKNNSLDWLVLYCNGEEITRLHCQSVQNLDWGKNASAGKLAYGDTIAPGSFLLRLWAQPRKFKGSVHEIIRCKTLNGLAINDNAMQIVNGHENGRWLIHNKYNSTTHKDTNFAWSAGCIIVKTGDMELLDSALKALNLTPGMIISGEIIEVNNA